MADRFIFQERKSDASKNSVLSGSEKFDGFISEEKDSPILDKYGKKIDLNAPVQKDKKKDDRVINQEKTGGLLDDINEPLIKIKKNAKPVKKDKKPAGEPRYIGLDKKFEQVREGDKPKMRAVRERVADYHGMLSMEDENERIAGVPMALNQIIQACNRYCAWRFPFKWGRGKKRLEEVKALRQKAIAELDKFNLEHNAKPLRQGERIERKRKNDGGLLSYDDLKLERQEENRINEPQNLIKKGNLKENEITPEQAKSLMKVVKQGEFTEAQIQASETYFKGFHRAIRESLGERDEKEKQILKAADYSDAVEYLYVDGVPIREYVADHYNYRTKSKKTTSEERVILRCYASMIFLRQNHVVCLARPVVKNGKASVQVRAIPAKVELSDGKNKDRAKKENKLKQKEKAYLASIKKDYVPGIKKEVQKSSNAYTAFEGGQSLYREGIQDNMLTHAQKMFVMAEKLSFDAQIKKNLPPLTLSDDNKYKALGFRDMADMMYINGEPLQDYLEANTDYEQQEDAKEDQLLRYAYFFRILKEKKEPVTILVPMVNMRQNRIEPKFLEYRATGSEGDKATEEYNRKAGRARFDLEQEEESTGELQERFDKVKAIG